MPTPKAWHEESKRILEREQQPSDRPVNKSGTVVCGCGCHRFCHTCGNRFISGRMHINCADTLTGSSIIYADQS